MSKATEIFKLQRAVFGDDLCLIYNENRTVMGQYLTTKDELKILQGEYKTYFWGKHNDNTGKTEFIRHCTQDEIDKIGW